MEAFFTSGKATKYAIGGVLGVLLLATASGSFYTVAPSERAFVRRLGQTTTTAPIGPGTHLKAPFISSVDRLQVSQSSLAVPAFSVNTIDNQQVSLSVDIQYTIPESDVYRLLYEMGRSGSADIDEPIRAIIQDRVSRIFSSKNTNTISADREQIQEATQKFVGDALTANFGIKLVSLQIAHIGFSNQFVESNNVAVLAKNRAIQEENQLKVVGYQAQQGVRTTEGMRDQRIAEAEGTSRAAVLQAEASAKATELQAAANANATLLRVNADAKALLTQAEADKQAAQLRGSGEAAALKASVEAMGGPDKYLEKLRAEAQKRWSGSVPQIMTSDKAAAMMPMVFPPIPAAK